MLNVAQDFSRSSVSHLPHPLRPLSDFRKYSIAHLSLSPDGAVVALLLFGHDYLFSPKHAAYGGPSTERLRDCIVLYHLDCRAVTAHISPCPVLAQHGASIGRVPTFINFCQFSSPQELLVAWEQKNSENETSQFIHCVNTTNNMWTPVYGPSLKRMDNGSSRWPNFCYDTKSQRLYLLTRDGRFDILQAKLTCIDATNRRTEWTRFILFSMDTEDYLDIEMAEMAVWNNRLYLLTFFNRVLVYDISDESAHIDELLPDLYDGYPASQQDVEVKRLFGTCSSNGCVYIAGGGYSATNNDRHLAQGNLGAGGEGSSGVKKSRDRRRSPRSVHGMVPPVFRNNLWKLDLTTLTWSKIQCQLPSDCVISKLCICDSGQSFIFGSWQTAKALCVNGSSSHFLAAAASTSGSISSPHSSSIGGTMDENRIYLMNRGLFSLFGLAWNALRAHYPEITLLTAEQHKDLGLVPMRVRWRLPQLSLLSEP